MDTSLGIIPDIFFSGASVFIIMVMHSNERWTTVVTHWPQILPHGSGTWYMACVLTWSPTQLILSQCRQNRDNTTFINSRCKWGSWDRPNVLLYELCLYQIHLLLVFSLWSGRLTCVFVTTLLFILCSFDHSGEHRLKPGLKKCKSFFFISDTKP